MAAVGSNQLAAARSKAIMWLVLTRAPLPDAPHWPSLGAGEAASGPALAAIANAVCDATGLRLRRLPFTPDAIRRAALG